MKQEKPIQVADGMFSQDYETGINNETGKQNVFTGFRAGYSNTTRRETTIL